MRNRREWLLSDVLNKAAVVGRFGSWSIKYAIPWKHVGLSSTLRIIVPLVSPM